MTHETARHIAANIRRKRHNLNLTLKELNKRSGVSISMLSKIENSQTLPSIATYSRISSALGITLSELIGGQSDGESSLVRADERPIISRGPYSGSPLAFKKTKKMMEPFIFEYPYTKKFPKYRHNSEEMIFILRGAMEFKYGDRIIRLEKGDCFYYHASIEHGGRALNRKGATAIVIHSSIES